MQDGLNDLETYPELPTWTLVNQYTGFEQTVTDAMLEQAFNEETLMKIKTGRSRAWLLIEKNVPTNASHKLY